VGEEVELLEDESDLFADAPDVRAASVELDAFDDDRSRLDAF
jgi:hypothetical protein